MKYSITSIVALFVCAVYFSCEKNDGELQQITEQTNQNLFPSEANKDVIYVSNVPELMASARLTRDGNKVVVIKDGTYELSERLWITGDNIIYRSRSGNNSRVVLKGNGIKGNNKWIFGISGKNFALKDVTIGEVSRNGIHIYGEKNVDSIHIENVHFYDIGEYMIKISHSNHNADLCASHGIIKDCTFEHTNKIYAKNRSGGIDINHGRNWLINSCTFSNFCSKGNTLTEGAINIRNFSENCIVENNTIINCDRGIMFGFDKEAQIGGIIRNNMIYVSGKSGIYICSASNVNVFNNTVFNNSDYNNAIEYRLSHSQEIDIVNNITNRAIASLNKTEAMLSNNITNAKRNWFKNPENGNLHLTKNANKIINSVLLKDGEYHDTDDNKPTAYLSDFGADKRR